MTVFEPELLVAMVVVLAAALFMAIKFLRIIRSFRRSSQCSSDCGCNAEKK